MRPIVAINRRLQSVSPGAGGFTDLLAKVPVIQKRKRITISNDEAFLELWEWTENRAGGGRGGGGA